MNLQKVFSKLQKVYLLRSGQSVQTISAILIFSKRSKKGDDLNINAFNILDKVPLAVLVKRLESKFFKLRLGTFIPRSVGLSVGWSVCLSTPKITKNYKTLQKLQIHD